MSDDIVKRLAGLKRMLALAFGECNEQATIADGINSIERLRAELAAAVEHVRNTDEACNRYAAERDALRALLREAGDWIVPSSEADEFCARIDAALNNGGGDE